MCSGLCLDCAWETGGVGPLNVGGGKVIYCVPTSPSALAQSQRGSSQAMLAGQIGRGLRVAPQSQLSQVVDALRVRSRRQGLEG